MSRIGKQPVPVPSGVDVTIDGQTVSVKYATANGSAIAEQAFAFSIGWGRAVSPGQ